MKNTTTKTFFGEDEIQFHCWKSRLFPCTVTVQSFVLNRSETLKLTIVSNWHRVVSYTFSDSIVSNFLTRRRRVGMMQASILLLLFGLWSSCSAFTLLHARHDSYVRGDYSPLLSQPKRRPPVGLGHLLHIVNDQQQDYFVLQNLKFPVTLKFP